MGNRALRRQQAKTKERAGGAKAGGGGGSAPRALPRTGAKSQPARRGGIFGGPRRFVLDIWSELKKVVWPEREDVVHLTVVIVIVTIMIGAVLGGIDIGFGWLIDRTLLQ